MCVFEHFHSTTRFDSVSMYALQFTMLYKFAACILVCFLLGSAKGQASEPQDAYDRVNECMGKAFHGSEQLNREIKGSENYNLKVTDYYEQV